MSTDVTQFRNTSGPSTTRELCKSVSHFDIIMADTYTVGKRKLNQAGILILKDYQRLHPEDTHPTSHTLNTLLDRVRNAQNNQEISYNSISSWFQRRRTLLQKQALRQSTTSSTPPIVSFGQDNLHKLQTLVNATPNPSPEVLDTWASLFHVSRAVLLHAIHVILVEKAPQDVHQFQIDAEQNALHRLKTGPPIQRLPTPANSLTPEPAPAANDGGSPKFMKNECNTPTLAKATDSGRDMIAQFQQPRDHSSTNFIPAPALHDQLSPPPTPTVPATQVNSQATRAANPSTAASVANSLTTCTIFSGVVEACSDAVQGSHETAQPPKTAAEFKALFAPYETKLENLSRVLDVAFENPSADWFSRKTL
ncbi:hypothetical protein AGABI1DRAFT_106014 [Agaricus bisporus var. burnettii JB137-S8]|uniref:Homeobox domain-containing protein n=1 Tax=Agaricus bisporus var. burnettii (strain JB137-S8 / ATCC MYA-4627 / FGSC 10392) TaxID=597362 RepID=K5W369_AGABU|nr:uncharacterized protein AGABI1DRAFT_106014 [Agaricus bisporus var. burnettii JB137-S8]EKM81244.1 hypothetical protein AGABI1DRAFT_106014 [Agaricus bisporus var. burnettii JB137-S8]